MSASLLPHTITVKTPAITASAQPVAMTIQPAFSAFDLLSSTLATTPSPSRIKTSVPMNSPKKGEIIRVSCCFRTSATPYCSTACQEECITTVVSGETSRPLKQAQSLLPERFDRVHARCLARGKDGESQVQRGCRRKRDRGDGDVENEGKIIGPASPFGNKPGNDKSGATAAQRQDSIFHPHLVKDVFRCGPERAACAQLACSCLDHDPANAQDAQPGNRDRAASDPAKKEPEPAGGRGLSFQKRFLILDLKVIGSISPDAMQHPKNRRGLLCRGVHFRDAADFENDRAVVIQIHYPMHRCRQRDVDLVVFITHVQALASLCQHTDHGKGDAVDHQAPAQSRITAKQVCRDGVPQQYETGHGPLVSRAEDLS